MVMPITSTAARSARRSSPSRLLMIGLLMFAAGIMLIAWGARQVLEVYQSKSWPTTEGTVVSSYVHKRESPPGDKSKQPTYHAKINYAYTIDGIRYTSERIRFIDNTGGNREKAKKLVDKYFAGMTVTVYYDPDDPGAALLKPGFAFSNFIPCLAGLAFFLAGMLCFKTYGRAQSMRASQS